MKFTVNPWARGALVLTLATLATMAQATPAAVVELKPNAVAAFVAQHPYAVVQTTSPDLACKYCVGADKVFDQSAAQKHSLPWVFARVQWSPWHKMPDFGGVMKVLGVPSQVVFLKGKSVGIVAGRPANAALFAKSIVSVAKDNGELADAGQGEAAKADPQFADAAPALGPQVEPGLIRVLARDQFLERVVTACGKDYPGAKRSLTDTYRQWQGSNKSTRDAASNQFLKYIMQNDRVPMDEAMRLEKAAVQRLVTQELGLDWKKMPTEAQCGQVVNKLTALAVP